MAMGFAKIAHRDFKCCSHEPFAESEATVISAWQTGWRIHSAFLEPNDRPMLPV
jgi:hypothetical protein